MAKAWMVRAEQGGRLFDAFKDNSIVAVGWAEIGDLKDVKSRKTIAERVAALWPNKKAPGGCDGCWPAPSIR